MDGLTEGRIVHYVMQNGEHRPAIVVKVWNADGTANMTVFTDWMNDALPLPASEHQENVANGSFWATSVGFDETNKRPDTWHWIERA